MNEDDLRVKRTKLFICRAFDELITERAFSKISVKELCERAMVNRSTFYRYFTDKYDLFLYRIKSFLRDVEAEARAEAASDDLSEYFKKIICGTIEYIDKNRTLFESIAKDARSAEVLIELEAYVERRVTDSLKLQEKRGMRLCAKPEIVSLCFCETCFTLLLRWLRREIKLNAEEAAGALAAIMINLCSGERFEEE